MSTPQPTAGAMRAVEAMFEEDAARFNRGEPLTKDREKAQIIDRETGAAELVAALDRYTEFFDYLHENNPGWLGKMFGGEIVGKLNDAFTAEARARAALAKAKEVAS